MTSRVLKNLRFQKSLLSKAFSNTSVFDRFSVDDYKPVDGFRKHFSVDGGLELDSCNKVLRFLAKAVTS